MRRTHYSGVCQVVVVVVYYGNLIIVGCRLLDWRVRKKDGPVKKKNERIVVFRNAFDPKEFDVSCCEEYVSTLSMRCVLEDMAIIRKLCVKQ